MKLKSKALNVDQYRIYYTSQTDDTSADERWKSADTCVKGHQRIHRQFKFNDSLWMKLAFLEQNHFFTRNIFNLFILILL